MISTLPTVGVDKLCVVRSNDIQFQERFQEKTGSPRFTIVVLTQAMFQETGNTGLDA